MNNTKKGALVNNGWMLCPSKSFPGKFYNFNVATGEAVWSLNNNEIANLRKETTPNIQKVNNRFHGFPEPTTPPDNSLETTPTNIWPSTSTPLNPWAEPKRSSFPNNNYVQQSPASNPWPEFKISTFQNDKFSQHNPVFGQSAQFVPSLGQVMPGIPNVMPNFIWTPVQFPLPGWPQMPTNTRFGIDRVTQTCPIDRELFVHTSGVPLSQKFINFEAPSLCFDKENRVITKYEPTSPIKSPNPKSNLSKCIPEPIFNIEAKSPTKTVAHDSTLDEAPGENSTLSSHKKIEFVKMDTDAQLKDRNYLQKNDLRYLLLAKRRKLETINQKEPVQRKRTKVETKPPLKKKVTFNLSNQESPSISSVEEEEILSPKTSTFNYNKTFYKIPMSPTQTTLNYYSLLESKTSKKDDIHNCGNTEFSKPSDVTSIQSLPTHDNIPRNDTPSSDSLMYNLEKVQTNKNTHHSSTTETMKSIPHHSETPKSVPKNTETLKITPKNTETRKITPNNTETLKRNTVIPDKKAILANCENISTESLEVSEPPNKRAIEGEMPTQCNVTNAWYLVVDLDVLLDYLELIDNLLNSDEKCRLLIPHCIRKELDTLCIGDCQGQKRVFVARQLSRRLSAPQKQCVVELLSDTDNNISRNMQDSIIKCCVQVVMNQHHLVLLTNDIQLKARAKAFNINCYNTEEIKNGAIVRPKLFSELKKIKIIVNNNNNVVESETNPMNHDTDNKILVNTFKKRLFESNKKHANKNCDILVNITKPVDPESNKVNRVLTLKDNINFRNRSTALNNNTSNKSNENQDTNILNNNDDPNTLKTITLQKSNSLKTIEKSFRDENENLEIGKDRVDSTPEHSNDIENCSISNNNENNTNIHDTGIVSHTAAGQRIKTIMNALDSKSSEKNILNDTFNFKVPKLRTFKNGTTMASSLVRSPAQTDGIRSNFKKSVPWLANALKVYVKNIHMIQDKIISRMDEWTCTYTQIMEHFLADILQNRSELSSDRNLHESLICLKMMYEDKKLRKIIELLLEMLDRYTCSKGKLQLDTPPSDLMKMIGCALLLIQTLETIVRDTQILEYYKSALKCLISNIESRCIDLDPELLRPTAVCRSEMGDNNKQDRCNFLKEPSIIIDYLKKHYKEWVSYDESENVEASSNTISKGDYKIVRMFGKNVNMLKLDSNKSFTYNKLALVNNEENDMNKQPNTEATEPKKAKPKLKRTPLKTQNFENLSKTNKCDTEKVDIAKDNISSQKTDPKLLRFIDNISQNEQKYEEHGHTFSKLENGPKMIVDIKKIDEYEKKLKDRTPLDLDRLDYSATSNNSCEFSKKSINSDDNDEINKHFDNSDQSEFDINFDNYKTSMLSNKKELNNFIQDNITKNIINNPSIFDNFDTNLKRFNAIYNKVLKKDVNIKDDNEILNTAKDGMSKTGFQKDSSDGFAVLKLFLAELSNTFKNIYEFIVDFVKEIRDDILNEDRKSTLFVKSSKLLEAIQAVIQELQSIIERESYKDSLMLRSVGDSKDPKTTRYRHVVSKCLQQANILQNALKVILAVTIGDIDAISNNADSITSSIRNFVI